MVQTYCTLVKWPGVYVCMYARSSCECVWMSFFFSAQAHRVKKKASINKTVQPIFQNITLETHMHTYSYMVCMYGHTILDCHQISFMIVWAMNILILFIHFAHLLTWINHHHKRAALFFFSLLFNFHCLLFSVHRVQFYVQL